MTADPATSRLVTMPVGVPELTLGWEAIYWASKYLRHPNGPRAGERWKFIDSQLHFLLWWYAVNPDGSWLYHHSARRLVKGAGKSPFAGLVALAELCAPVRIKDFDSTKPGGVIGKPVDMPWVQIAAVSASQPLALDTPVPTPTGFRTVGDLEVGDEVFGSDGQPVPIRRLTPIYTGLPCYKVTFDDKEEIVASGRHSWTVGRANNHDGRREVVTVSTAEMARTHLRSSGGARYSMPVVGVEFPKVDDHIVDPYFLGLWLGNGTTKDSSIAYNTDYEADVIKSVTACLEPQDVIVVKPPTGRAGLLRVRRAPRFCRWGHDWTDDEKLNGKHIQCGQCLRVRPRPQGEPPFPTMRERLRKIGVLGNKHIPDNYMRSHHDQRMRLLQGLMDSDGCMNVKGGAQFVNRDLALLEQVRQLVVSLGFKVHVYDDVSGAKRLNFVPKDGRVVTQLTGKSERHLVTEGGTSKSRFIRDVEPVESVPVRCIGIDTEDHLFVVGHHNTLTHNTANTMRMVRALAAKGTRLAVDYKLDPGITKIYKPPNGILEVITSSASTAEGAEISFVVEDEVEHWLPATGGPVMAETLDRNLAKSGSRAMETSNAWEPGQGSVAEATYDAWVLQEEGKTRGKSKILYDARIAPPDTDLADEASLIKGLAAAYGDCWWVDLNVLKERVWSPKTRPEVARRFYLNQPTASEESWVTPMEWAACVDTTRLVADDEDIAMFFDGSKSRDATALLGCCMSDGHVFTLGVWEPDTKHDAESVVPVASVDAAVAQAFDRFSVVAFFADVQEWEGYVKTTWPERYADQLLVWSSPNTKESHPIAWDMRTRTYDFTMAVELTHEDIIQRQFTHDGDSRVARHVINAHRRPNRWGVSIGKETKDSPKKVDAAVCVVGARMVRRLVMSSPEWTKRSEPARTGRVFGF